MSIEAIEHVRQSLSENMQRLEGIAKNVSNMRTNGYKSVDFVTALQGGEVVGSALVNDAAGQAMSVQNNNSIYADGAFLLAQDKSSLKTICELPIRKVVGLDTSPEFQRVPLAVNQTHGPKFRAEFFQVSEPILVVVDPHKSVDSGNLSGVSPA